MKSDMDIRLDVEAELRWEPRVNAATAIRVTVKNGVATISGHVKSYLERSAAERAVERVSGVTAVADIEEALRRSAEVDAQKIGVDANGHTVTLTGAVRSSNERKEAERAAWAAPEVYAVDNRIAVSVP
jgi:osmotically-inducible protein OsmY